MKNLKMKQKENFFSGKILNTIQITNNFFWKSKIPAILVLALPFFFILVYYMLFTESGKNTGEAEIAEFTESTLPLVISLTVLPIFIMTLPSIHIEFKSSIILRIIKISNISKLKYIGSLFIFTSLIALFFLIINFIIFMCFVNTGIEQFSKKGFIFYNIDWFGLLYGIFTFIISSFSLGMLIGILTKKSLTAQIIGFSLLILTIGFSGQLIPLFVLAETPQFMQFTLAMPLNYSEGAIVESIRNNFIGLNDINNAESWWNEMNSPSKFYLFDFTNAFAILSFEGVSYTQILGKEIAEQLKVSNVLDWSLMTEPPDSTILIVYEPWHKIFNILMPLYIFGILIIASWFLFRWTNK